MPKQSTFDTNTPPNAKVIVPENNLAADTIGRDTAEIKIAMNSPSPLSDTPSSFKSAK